MKRTLLLVILAVAATWALLFFPLAKSTSKPTAPKVEHGTHDATPPESDAVPRVATPIGAQSAASTSRVQPDNAANGRAAQGAASSSVGQGDVRIVGSAVASTTTVQGSVADTRPRFDPEKAEATGELGEGVLSPDYRLLEESYVQEPRDGPWALENERKIRTVLMSSELAERVVIVHCQSTVCRIHLEPQGNDPFGDLVKVPGLAATTGIDSSTPYSLNGTELIVYAKPENAVPQPR